VDLRILGEEGVDGLGCDLYFGGQAQFSEQESSYLANQELSILVGLASLHRENGYSISTQYQHYAGNS
jgi:hypothetical protein